MVIRADRSWLLAPLVAVGLAAACAAPPQRELGQAQGAVDAARAAGADRYATEEYQAAVSALKQAQDAVIQRDYRLALSHALDSRERAQNAAKQAAERGTLQRSEAEHALSEAAATLDQASTRLAEAESGRVSRQTLTKPRAAVANAVLAVQKAGTAIQHGDYQQARDSMSETTRELRGVIAELNAAMKMRGAGPAS